jgi:type III restriction enzyme
VEEIESPEEKQVLDRVRERVESENLIPLFAKEIVKEAESRHENDAKAFIARIIEIPRAIVVQKGDVVSGFNDFNLDTSALNFQPVSEEIYRRVLQSNEVDHIIGSGGIARDRLDNILVNELLDQPEIDYDEQTELLFKLAGQVVSHFASYLDEKESKNVVLYHKQA